jgi:hypothetical protein
MGEKTLLIEYSSGHNIASIIIKHCQDAYHWSSLMKAQITGAKNRKIMLTL